MWLAALVLLLLVIASSFFAKSQAQHDRHDHRLPPGPTPLPVFGSLLSLRKPLHRHFASLAKIYGPIIHLKLGLLSCIVVSSSEMAKEVLRTHDAEFAYRPHSKFGEYFSFGWKDVAVAPYGESWKNLKMITALHLLSPSKLDAAAAYQESEMGLMIKDVARLASTSKVINLREVISKFVSSAFCLVLFGKRDVPVVDLISLIERQTLSINVGKFIPALDCLDLHGVNRRMRDDLMPKLKSLLAGIIQEHRQSKLKIESSGQEFIPKDWTDVLLSLQDAADNNLPDVSIMALLTDLVAAGIDNMKGAVEWAMAEVIQNPRVMQKAQEETRKGIGIERLVRPSDVPNLPYMHAIVKEVLRLHPTGPLGVPHFNPSEAVLAGYRIPKGSTVLINIWAIGRDPKHWPDPEDFRPERFEGTEINVFGQGAQLEMIPFSAGRRMCPGHPVAVRFIPFAVASLIHTFDWSLPPDQNSVDLTEKGGTLASKLASELTAVATSRLSCKSYTHPLISAWRLIIQESYPVLDFDCECQSLVPLVLATCRPVNSRFFVEPTLGLES